MHMPRRMIDHLYYEKIGLLSSPPRSEGGHRLYSKEHLVRLVFLRRSRELGSRLKKSVCFLDWWTGEVTPAGKSRL